MKIIYFFLFLISIFKLTISTEIISFKLKYNNISIIKNNNISYIFNELRNTYISSFITIGNPEFSIKTNFSMITPHFSLSSYLELINENKLINSYDIRNSKTFQNISSLKQFYVQSTNDINAKEKFRLSYYNSEKKKYNDKIINDLDFVLGVRNQYQKIVNFTEIYFINIGLQIYSPTKYSQEKQFNFIYLLKNKNIINNYNWFVIYEKINLIEDELYNLDDLINGKQEILIGGSPDEFEPNIFYKEQLFQIYSNYFLWISEFKSVYFYKNQTKFNSGVMKQIIYHNEARIDFNNFFIYAPSLYFSMIKNEFFNYYKSKNVCYYSENTQIEYIYCEKSENFNINNLRSFPILYFEHKEFNFTFEFNYKDLFAEIDNKYIFLIAIKDGDMDNWYLGNIFLRKYQFVFNQDSKTIGFYNTNLVVNKEKKREINKSIDFRYIVLIISFCIMCLVIGFFSGNYIYKTYKHKKKRANELDDDFEYTTDKYEKIID